MRTLLTAERALAAWLVALSLLCIPHNSHAQDFCPGDLDHDGMVTAADAAGLLPLLFVDPLTLDIDTLVRADVNDDGVLSNADIVAILALDAFPCATPPPLATATPTPTATPIVRPTQTRILTPPPMPTPACDVQQGVLGATNGRLDSTDCQQPVSGNMRLVDVYNISSTPGTAITVQLTTVAPLAGYVVVVDPAGQFDRVEGAPPIQFTVTSGKPYQVLVTSDPHSTPQSGDYTLLFSSTVCPPPLALPFDTSRSFNLDGTECPEPGTPTVGTLSEPTDVYTFTVTDVPKNVSLIMQQLSANDTISPVLALLGPDGFELVAAGDNFDCSAPTGDLSCAEIRFLALQRGTYTILAGGFGGTGRYSLALASPRCNPSALSAIPPDHPLACPGSAVGCVGTLQGETARTPCAAPLPAAGNIDTVPEPSSPAALYSFAASAGDVISVKMLSDGDPHVYLIGPAPENAVVADDNTSVDAELAATLAVPGTYTIIAANDSTLAPDDDPVSYTLLIQKCPVRGGLNPLTGRAVPGTYNVFDCLGSGDIPYRSYAFSGRAGQFVTTTVTSSELDSSVRVFAPDGGHVDNDDDLLQDVTSDARVSRILPMDGTYFVEVSASPDGPAVDLSVAPTFTVRAQTCSTMPAMPGPLSGTWDSTDCDLTGGRTGDIYTFPAGTTPAVASVSPPSNGCIVALLDDGSQVPNDGCSTTPVDFPVQGPRVLGFIVAGAQTSTRGPYTVGFSRCPATAVGFGDSYHGVLNGTNCADSEGIRADWFLIQAPADLVYFNWGMTGRISAAFPLAGVLSDLGSSTFVTGEFSEDPSPMFAHGTTLGAVLRVTGATPEDRGGYDLSIDRASLRQ